MASKEQKKAKIKLLRKKQQEAKKNKDKANINPIEIKKYEDFDIFDGIRYYTLIKIEKIIRLITNNIINEDNLETNAILINSIIDTCELLIELSNNPVKIYTECIDEFNKLKYKEWYLREAEKLRVYADSLGTEGFSVGFKEMPGYSELEKSILKKNMLNAMKNPEKFDVLYRHIDAYTVNINKIKRAKKSINNYETHLNNAERAVIKFYTQGIVSEFALKLDNKYESIDYGAIKVYFDIMYRAIFEGMENKFIKNIKVYVGYGDIVTDIKITYLNEVANYDLNGQPKLKWNNGNEILSGEEFHIKDITNISIENSYYIDTKWISQNERYNAYTVFKHKYPAFCELSLNSLANAFATKKEYDNIEIGREFITYNGIIISYISALEIELGRLIRIINKNNNKKMNLINLINTVYDLKIDGFNSEVIEILHNIRKIRNKAAHAMDITKEECEFVETEIIIIYSYISDCLTKYSNVK
ncbi:hypothetical protein [Clostridium cuniculi]|uniref:hypothetical protein n=1 Tax=Clostridium cuniculi TaxID=2548455 RepID=UPI0018AAFCF2|nr:hypothetical protein [Clostridium cuniculi]